MDNPWLAFNPSEGQPRFHDLDRAHALSFNKARSRKEYRLAEHLEPFPYLGNPEAPILVLLANPGVSEQESQASFRMSPEELLMKRRNLTHSGLDSSEPGSVFPNAPKMESLYFDSRVKELIEETSPERVSKGLFFVNFHAYHSKSWQAIPFTFETQRYSFDLVDKAIKRGSIIVTGRNLLGWFTAVPDLYDYKYRVAFKSPRSSHLSKGNLENDAYQEILKRL